MITEEFLQALKELEEEGIIWLVEENESDNPKLVKLEHEMRRMYD